jgi:hypothetical protein
MAKSTRGKSETVAAEKPITVDDILDQIKKEEEPQQPQIIIMSPKGEKAAELKAVGKTFEERLLDYVKKCGGETIINDFLRIEYKELLGLQETAKRIGVAIKKLVESGQIEAQGNYAMLGKFFYKEGTTETQYYTPLNTKITVKVL